VQNTRENDEERGDKLMLGPINALCPYYTMFPIEFPLNILSNGSSGQWVFDPFCGRGTTTLAARYLGMNTISNDINEVALAITTAKLANVNPSKIVKKAKDLIANSKEAEVPQEEYWSHAFHPKTLNDICLIRAGLFGKKDRLSNALRGVMLGILHGPVNKSYSYLSNQMQRTFAPKPRYAIDYWKRNELRPPHADVIEVIEKKARRVYSTVLPTTKSIILNQDARKLKKSSRIVDYIVTSPPYLGMKTYGVDQWLRQWFIGGPSYPNYNEKGCIGFTGIDNFVNSLSMVWTRCSEIANPGCTLSVRLGSFGKRLVDCSALMQESIRRSDSGWTHSSTVEIGAPSRNSSRQASLMGNAIKSSASSDFEFNFIYTPSGA